MTLGLAKIVQTGEVSGQGLHCLWMHGVTLLWAVSYVACVDMGREIWKWDVFEVWRGP